MANTTAKLVEVKGEKFLRVTMDIPYNPRHVTQANGKKNKNITLGNVTFNDGSYKLEGVGDVCVQAVAVVDIFSAIEQKLEWASVTKEQTAAAA